MKLHVDWVHASARQLKRAPADSESGNSHMANYVGEVLECEICRACGKAPHVPIAGASTASVYSEKVQADLLFWMIFLRCAMDMFSEYSLLLPAQSTNPQEVRDVFCGGW